MQVATPKAQVQAFYLGIGFYRSVRRSEALSQISRGSSRPIKKAMPGPGDYPGRALARDVVWSQPSPWVPRPLYLR